MLRCLLLTLLSFPLLCWTQNNTSPPTTAPATMRSTVPQTPPPTASDIRLTGGKNYLSGRLELKINNTWGKVCNFENSFTENAGRFACKQLQLGRGQLLKFDTVPNFGYINASNNVPTTISNLTCSFFATYSPSKSIQTTCRYTAPPVSNCTDMDDIALECSDCNDFYCKGEGTCVTSCNGVEECKDGSDEAGLFCGVSLSTSAKIAIGVVAGIVFLAIVAALIAAGICYATGVCGSKTSSSSSSRSTQVAGTSYTPGPDKLHAV